MNGPSRTIFLAFLAVVGAGIIAMAAYSVRGLASDDVFAMRGTGTAFTPKTFAPVAAGNAPRVTIDDPNSGVTIDASSDGLVHVKDDTSFSGVTLRSPQSYPQLTVTQDSTGVHISRPEYHASWSTFLGFSNSRQHIEVAVPPASAIIVSQCASADLSDLKNGANVNALDGHIAFARVDGAIVAHSGDGHITAADVTSPSLDLSTDDGSIEVHTFTASGPAPVARLHSGDGHIDAAGIFSANGKYEITTNDGHIHLALAPGSSVTVDASTSDGNLSIDRTRHDGDDSVEQTVRVGGGASPMRVHTDDGSISISTT